jgi:hypothetical protein
MNKGSPVEYFGNLKDIIAVAIHTYMGDGEIFKLPAKMVDLEKGLINLPARVTKSRKPRNLPMLSRARSILERLAAAADPKQSDRVFHVRDVNTPLTTVRRKDGIEDLQFSRSPGDGHRAAAQKRNARCRGDEVFRPYRIQNFREIRPPKKDTYEKARNLMDTFEEI